MPAPAAESPLWILAALAAPGLIALAAWPAVRAPGRARIAATVFAAAAMLACPMLAPDEPGIWRFLAACVAAATAGKLIDYSRAALRSPSAGLRAYLVLLAHPMAMTLEASRRRLEAGAPRWPAARACAVSLPVLAASAAGLWWLCAGGVTAGSFLLDHVAKVVVLGAAIESGTQFACAAARLAGLDVEPLVDFAFLARTPADFWRRYNRMVGDWLTRNVFVPAGGRRHYLGGLAAAFAVTAVVHEYLMDMGSGSVDGYQLAFFTLQGAAVAATARLEGRWKSLGPAARVAARAGTVAFLLATSVLFFTGLDKVVPGFYSAERWLP